MEPVTGEIWVKNLAVPKTSMKNPGKIGFGSFEAF